MKHLLIIFLAIILMSTAETASAQRQYNVALGGRLGTASGLTLKGFVSERIALEGILSTRFLGPWGAGIGNGNGTLTGLVEWHFPIGNVQGFNWLVGGGAHIGFYGTNRYVTRNNVTVQESNIYIGLDAIGGIEYTLPRAPVTFQLDIKPTIHLLGTGIWFDNIAISIRYAFR